MRYKIPFINPREHYSRLKSEIDSAITDCLSNGDLVNRGQLKEFERCLADFVGVKYAIGVNSGYHALHFALLGTGINRGDEVITVGHTFVATVSAIIHCGAKPVLVEVDKDYNMNPEDIERAITPRTKALLPVHLNGRVCDMDQLNAIAKQYGIAVIEDAAQALGAAYKGQKAGSFGAAGCFSFYPFKVLGGFGDGGAITTNDPYLARTVSLLRYNGEDRETGEYHFHGYSALLDNVQAAVLNIKLQHLPKWIEHRRLIASLYQEGLKGIPELILPHFNEQKHFDIFQNYVVRTKERDRLRMHLKEDSIETLVHWPKPMWEHKRLKLKNPGLSETPKISQEVLSVPMSAETTPAQVEIVISSIKKYFGLKP